MRCGVQAASLFLTLLCMKYINPASISSSNNLETSVVEIPLAFSPFNKLFSLADKMYLGTLLALLPSLTLAGIILPRDTNEDPAERRPTTTYAGTCTCKKHPFSLPSALCVLQTTQESTHFIFMLTRSLYKILKEAMLTLQ